MLRTKPSYLEAAENGDVQKMKNLISNDPFFHTERSESEEKFSRNVMHKTALNKASKNGREKVVEYLIVEQQVHIEGDQRNQGKTPLHLAANNGHLNVALLTKVQMLKPKI